MSEDFSIDLSNVQERSFDALPPGKYVAFIEETPTYVPARTNPSTIMFKVRWKIEPGQPGQGRVIFDNIIVKSDNKQAQDSGLARLKSLLTKGNFEEPATNKLEAWKMTGIRCLLVVVQDEYNGKITNKIKYYDEAPKEVVSSDTAHGAFPQF